MKFLVLVFLSFLLFNPTVFANQALPAYSQHYDDTRNPFDDAKAAIKLAKASNRNVLIEIGGKWCGWCTKMDAFLTANPNVAEQLHKHFVVIKVNVSDSNEKRSLYERFTSCVRLSPHVCCIRKWQNVVIKRYRRAIKQW